MIARRRLLVLVWTLPSLVFLLAAAVVYGAYRIAPPDRLDDAERTQVMAALRAGVDGTAPVDCPVTDATGGPVIVTLWVQGKALVRVDGAGATIGAAVDAAATALRRHQGLHALDAAARTQARLQVDVVSGHAPLGDHHWLFGAFQLPGLSDYLTLNTGIEGIAIDLGEKPVVLLPHELAAGKAMAARKPSKAIADFSVGLDVKKIRSLLATRAGGDARAGEVARWYRVRTDTFVERPVASRVEPPLPLVRGVPPAPPVTAATLRAAALAGGRFLVAHLAPNGRYIYEHDVASGAQTNPKSASYSMPRHAGTTYFLAELYRITKEPWLHEPIERAFAHLAELMANGKCAATLPDGTAIDCVMDRTERLAHLGSTALSVVALVEYQRATGDARYLPTATKLSAFLLWMQRPDGSFRHLYDPKTQRPDEDAMLLYYSGEAALALARMHVVTGDPRYAAAAERALDWLVDSYDVFMGGFFYGEEHWTCIAAEAAYPAVKHGKHVDFCHGYGAFLRAQQAEANGTDQADLAGSYMITPFFVAPNTPAGSRTEAMISAYLLGRHHGRPDPAVRQQIRDALAYVLGQQIRPDTDWAVVGPGLGGVPGSPIDRTVRIDYVQHVCSAFIRASEWIDAL